MARLPKIVGAMLLALFLAGPAMAQGVIPRSYPINTFNLADRNKPAEQAAAERAAADADAAACNAGVASACGNLGLAYETGAGRPQNRPVAELVYRRACDAADPAGCLRLGRLLATMDEPADQQEAAVFTTRACRLGAIAGCEEAADNLAAGVQGPPDPASAEALRRATCQRGSLPACRALAASLIGQGRTPAERDEGRALLDTQCRSGDRLACRDAASHWRREITPAGGRSRFAEYLGLGCAAGDGSACYDAGFRELARDAGAAGRAAALGWLDRACALDKTGCPSATQIREEPLLAARCDDGDGDGAACVALGQMLAEGVQMLRDAPRALALLGTACEAGTAMAASCPVAAGLLQELSPPGAGLDPARLDAYLARGCAAGSGGSCEWLADALVRASVLPQDMSRAAALYVPQCEAGRKTACTFLEDHARTDPAAPLMLAGANFGPELTPEEQAALERAQADEEARARAEERQRNCATTTAEFAGQSYTDTLCLPIQRVRQGFAVKRGTAPWQALLWRPATLGQTRFSPSERVLCGGAVIREGWILTAAHCLTDIGGVPITTGGHRLRLGLSNPLDDEGFSYPVMRVFRHPDFAQGTLAFDVALVQYNPRAGQPGREVLPIARIRVDPQPLASRPASPGAPVYTYGWGRTEVDGGERPDVLRGARLELRGTASCTNTPKWKNHGRDNRANSVLCAAGASGQQACSGDSGGPLITYDDADGIPTVIGVVSAGAKCGTTGVPSRYIRISHPSVSGWIGRTLASGTRR